MLDAETCDRLVPDVLIIRALNRICDTETIVQTISKTPLDFSESKKSLNVLDNFL